jgi:hypothetical protein
VLPDSKGNFNSARGRDIRGVSLVPDRKRIYADMAKLFWQDLSNVEAGIYPLPADRDGVINELKTARDDLETEVERVRDADGAPG